MPRARRSFACLALACAALCAATAPAAHADRVVETYDITYTGEGGYHRHDVHVSPHSRTDWTFDAAFTWNAEATGVEVVDGRLPATLHPVAEVQVKSARSDFKAVSYDGEEVGSCTGTQPEDFGVGSLGDWPVTDGTRRYVFDPLEELIIPMPCSGVLAGGDVKLVFGNGLDLEGTLEVPPAAQSAGHVIQLVSKPGDVPCPQRTPMSVACDYEWSGQIELRRTSKRTVEDKPREQEPKPPVPGPPTTPRTPGDIAVDVITRELERQKAAENDLVKNVTEAIDEWLSSDDRIADDIHDVLIRETSKMNVELRCPGTCSGSVKAYGASGPASPGSGRPLATGTLKPAGGAAPRARTAVAGHRRVRATLRFSKAARKRLARRRHVAFRVALEVDGVPGVRRATNTVRLRRR